MSDPLTKIRIVWSNFEIGDLDLWRGEAYSKFFDFLDEKGGFYYEVRFAGASIFLVADDSYSVGVMHPYTVLEQLSSPRKNK